MKLTEQRITIAKACGWDMWTETTGKHWWERGIHRPDGCQVVHGSEGDPYLSWEDAVEDGLIPDYLNDLNAMHEAEKVLHALHNAQLCVVYQDHLNEQMERDRSHYCAQGMGYHATAPQRAEAFLKTLNLWTS